MAVDDVSLSLAEGEILGLIGPNGAGKSTLFNLMSGVVRPDRGRISFAGEEITACGPAIRLATWLRTIVSYPFRRNSRGQ